MNSPKPGLWAFGTVDPEKINEIVVLETIQNGEVVWAR
jgi:hypothetical protein